MAPAPDTVSTLILAAEPPAATLPPARVRIWFLVYSVPPLTNAGSPANRTAFTVNATDADEVPPARTTPSPGK